jgi:hypothetical protein
LSLVIDAEEDDQQRHVCERGQHDDKTAVSGSVGGRRADEAATDARDGQSDQ